MLPTGPRPAGPCRAAPRPIDPVPARGDRRRLRIGLLGGSFNPAHAGHRHAAAAARAALRLDQVWLLVSPGNPLKPVAGMAPFAARLASARAVARPPWLLATGIEAALGTRYTADTLARLRRCFPRARFALLVGADNLAQLPRWRRWRRLVRDVPLAVVPRPGYTRPALAGRAARALARHRRAPGALLAPEGAARPGHPEHPPGGNHAPWCLVPTAEHPASATAIRAAAAAAGSQPDRRRP